MSIVFFVLLGSFPGLARSIGDEAFKMIYNTVLDNQKYLDVAIRVRARIEKHSQEPDLVFTVKVVEEELAIAA